MEGCKYVADVTMIPAIKHLRKRYKGNRAEAKYEEQDSSAGDEEVGDEESVENKDMADNMSVYQGTGKLDYDEFNEKVDKILEETDWSMSDLFPLTPNQAMSSLAQGIIGCGVLQEMQWPEFKCSGGDSSTLF